MYRRLTVGLHRIAQNPRRSILTRFVVAFVICPLTWRPVRAMKQLDMRSCWFETFVCLSVFQCSVQTSQI